MKKGKPLTVARGREIAENGGLAWLEWQEYDEHDPKSYNGPVVFEAATIGYYVNQADGSKEAFDAAVTAMLSDISSMKGIKVSSCIMDIEFGDFDGDDDELTEFYGEGQFSLYEVKR